MIPETPAEFRAAVRSGHGRAILALRRPHPPQFERIVLRTCFGEADWDSQVEDRTAYLVDLLHAGGLVEPFLRRLPRAMASTRHCWILRRLCELAYSLARAGHQPAAAALRAHFARPPRASDLADEGIGEYLRLDRREAAMRLARRIVARGRLLDPYLAEPLVSCAREVLGARGLARAAAACPELARLAAIAGGRRRRVRRAARRRVSDAEFREYLARATGCENDPPAGAYLVGRRATVVQLRRAAAAFDRAQTRGARIWLLRVFAVAGRARIFGIARLAELARAPRDEELRALARQALAGTTDPRVRAVAEEQLTRRRIDGAVLELLACNPRAGDAELVLAALPARPGAEREHDIESTVCDLIERCAALFSPRLLRWCYERSVCGLCRQKVVAALVRRGTAPRRLLEECRYDANVRTRRLAERALRSTRKTTGR